MTKVMSVIVFLAALVVASVASRSEGAGRPVLTDQQKLEAAIQQLGTGDDLYAAVPDLLPRAFRTAAHNRYFPWTGTTIAPVTGQLLCATDMGDDVIACPWSEDPRTHCMVTVPVTGPPAGTFTFSKQCDGDPITSGISSQGFTVNYDSSWFTPD